jgi:CHAT domain-containing protein
MPALAERSVSVVPSASMWQRARARTAPANGGTVLVAGPGLGTGGAEVDVLARTVPGATLLRDGAATVEASLAALDGAALAHVAAHGDFRPDSPMFSSLVLDDGPLTVHDLELLDHAPHRFVLSACESGMSVPVGSDELLGLTSALLSLGTAGVLASVAEVNDEATVPFMLDLHRALASGVGLPDALLEARRQAAGDDLAEATAASFVALGV